MERYIDINTISFDKDHQEIKKFTTSNTPSDVPEINNRLYTYTYKVINGVSFLVDATYPGIYFSKDYKSQFT